MLSNLEYFFPNNYKNLFLAHEINQRNMKLCTVTALELSKRTLTLGEYTRSKLRLQNQRQQDFILKMKYIILGLMEYKVFSFLHKYHVVAENCSSTNK